MSERWRRRFGGSRYDACGGYRGLARTGETHPFPCGDERFGLPQRDDLHLVTLRKPLT